MFRRGRSRAAQLVAPALFALILAACRAAAPGPTPAPTPHLLPTALPSATPIPPPTLPPSPTALSEGLIVRLGTPDPSPNCPDHYPWFFENQAEECAAILNNAWGVMQPFEHGLMVWFQGPGPTYILIEDGSLFKPYEEAVDPADTPFPGPDPGIVPPEGLYQPELGFAKFWRGVVPGYDWVRERLGWALAPETGYSAFWQCSTAEGDASRCYFTGPRDEIVVLARGGVRYWNYWQEAVR